METIAKRTIERKIVQTIPAEEWYRKYSDGLGAVSFIVEEVLPSPTSSITIGKIDIAGISKDLVSSSECYRNYIAGTWKIGGYCGKLALPLVVPRTVKQIHFVRSMICSAYDGNPTEREPTDHIVFTFLFCLMQHVTFALGIIRETKTNTEEHLYAEILLWAYDTVVQLSETSSVGRNLVHSLSVCSEPSDVIERGLAYIAEGNELTATFFEQTILLSLARTAKHFTPTAERKNFTIAVRHGFAGIASILFVVPIISRRGITISKNASSEQSALSDTTTTTTTSTTSTTKYTEMDADMFCAKLGKCYAAFTEKMGDTTISPENDNDFEVSSLILRTAYEVMVEENGLYLEIPYRSWFSGKMREISDNRFEYQRPDVFAKYNLRLVPLCVTVNERGNLSRRATVSAGKIVPETVTQWAGVEISMQEGEAVKISYSPLADSVVLSGNTEGKRDNVANICFLATCPPEAKNTLCFNKGGSYSMITGMEYNGTRYNQRKQAKEVWLACRDAKIHVVSCLDGETRLSSTGCKCIMMLKNVEVDVVDCEMSTVRFADGNRDADGEIAVVKAARLFAS